MREYMPKVGTMGLDMMFRTCTVQVRGLRAWLPATIRHHLTRHEPGSGQPRLLV